MDDSDLCGWVKTRVERVWIARIQMDGEVKGKQMTVKRTDSMGWGVRTTKQSVLLGRSKGQMYCNGTSNTDGCRPISLSTVSTTTVNRW